MNKSSNLSIQNVLIYGAGAIGCFYGAKLQRLGYNLTYLSKYLSSRKTKKLSIKSIWGDFNIPAKIIDKIDEGSIFDLVIYSSKIIDPEVDTQSFINHIKQHLHDNSIILVLQNGLNTEELLAKQLKKNTILGGLAFTCINRIGDKIHHLDYGLVKIGALKKEDHSIANSLTEIFNNAEIPTEALKLLRKGRFEKLLWNVPFNSMSVIFQSTTENLVLDGTTKNIAFQLMSEIQLIAKTEGIKLVDKDKISMIHKTGIMEPYKTSMLIDYENKRPMEVETILGEPLRIARKAKLKTPYLEMMYYQLKYLNSKIQ